ncbi:aminopeptidase N [Novosphingobium sp.]|uniref:aminopeptidase N n=1 Tax=Novosphingobium sp. TaxID=1874826 RepID=UPI0035B1086E
MDKALTRLADYRPYPFAVPSISLDVALDPERTVVRAVLEIAATDGGDAAPALVLDGKRLELNWVRIDGRELASEEYCATPEQLVIHHPPRRFRLETEVVINPSRNPSKKGLFWHSGVLATQCEAEGFRQITYFPDRPDVLTLYTVRLEAERAQFPTLLSNGEQCGSGRAGSRHWTLWRDPYAKPSYIFAMIAGRFDALRDRYVTTSGRAIDLAILAEPGEAGRCRFAMESLKAALAWDERVFGLEYDLPIYNVVALPAYAGAQENKGLNLFGADGIIADPEITTDEEFSLIKRIIGHEYFHNWTGNRVTCRDWFQLSLKEGLTRLRDQLFMEDELEAGTYRIEQVKALRRNQFPEDDGPAAHPVQPTEFVEIENFYTTTIYEKGAEVLRMLRTMVGPEAFASALRAYLARFDGQAATIEDLFDTFAAETGLDLAQFRRWLRQAGRPTVVAQWRYDADQRQAVLTLTQRMPDKPGPGGPMHIPVRIALLDIGGAMIGEPQLVHLTDWTQSLRFDGLDARPVPSILRQCSAPVTLECELPDEDLVLLALHDDDAFVAWNSVQQLFTRTVRALAVHSAQDMARRVPASIVTLARQLIAEKADGAPGLVAQMLAMPDEPALSEGLDRVPLDGHIAARHAVKRAIAEALGQEMTALYRELGATDPADLSPFAISRRSLRSALLDLLLASGDEEAVQLCLAQVRHGPSMTEKFEALCLISHVDHPERKAAFDAFYTAYADQPLVVDKWFKAYALSRAPGVIDEIIALEGHPAFDIQNTARAAAYYGSLFRQNRVTFHDPSGKGYRFLADRLLMMDQMGRGRPAYFMPQLDQWSRFDEPRQGLMRAELQRVAETPGISATLKEVVARSLA